MNHAIEICNYSYVYPDSTVALDSINVTIEPGEKVVMVGPNGAGKSTLLQAIVGFIRGTGTIRIDGMELSSRTLKQIRARLGCCLDNPDDRLFMPTLYEDVIFGPLNMNLSPGQVKDQVDRAIETVGVTTLANKATHHLSVGQKRVAAIATVLSMAPQIILFDGPEIALDPRNRKRLEETLSSMSQTLLIATSNVRFAAAMATRVMVIDQGRIVADGPAESILYDQDLMNMHGLETP